MDFGELFRVILRRWRVSVPVLVLTVAATAMAYLMLPTTYESTAQLSLIGSRIMAAQPGDGHNPYAVVGALGPVASILASNLSSDQAAQQLQARGMTNGFTAVVPPFAAGPFVALTVTGPNSTTVRESMPVVIQFAQQHLAQLQGSGPGRTPTPGMVRAVVIAPAGSPVPVRKTKIEVVAGVAIVGLILLVLLSFGAEGRALRRAELRGTRPADSRDRTAEPDEILIRRPGGGPGARRMNRLR